MELPSLECFGLACAYHCKYDIVTVVNFAGEIIDLNEARVKQKLKPPIPVKVESQFSSAIANSGTGVANGIIGVSGIRHISGNGIGMRVSASNPVMNSNRSLPKFSMSKQSTFRETEEIQDPEELGFEYEGHEFDQDWPEDAIGVKQERFHERKNGKNVIRVVKIYRMLDGSIMTREAFESPKH